MGKGMEGEATKEGVRGGEEKEEGVGVGWWGNEGRSRGEGQEIEEGVAGGGWVNEVMKKGGGGRVRQWRKE